MTYMQTADGAVFETSNPESWPEAKNLGSGAKGLQARREYIRRELQQLLQPGQTVYTILRYVSASGIKRRISVCAVIDGEIRLLDRLTAELTGRRIEDSHEGIVCGGGGMDMGFHVVYELGAAIWPDGTPEPHGTRNGTPDCDGGFALRHSWL